MRLAEAGVQLGVCVQLALMSKVFILQQEVSPFINILYVQQVLERQLELPLFFHAKEIKFRMSL